MSSKLGISASGYAALAAMLCAGGAAQFHLLVLAGGLFASGLFLTFKEVLRSGT